MVVEPVVQECNATLSSAIGDVVAEGVSTIFSLSPDSVWLYVLAIFGGLSIFSSLLSASFVGVMGIVRSLTKVYALFVYWKNKKRGGIK